MIKIIHCADLHLSLIEKNYSLSILQEIISISNKNSCDYLIISGDLFDSFKEINNLRDDFRNLMTNLNKKTEVFFMSGNHEELDKNKNELDNFDFGNNVKVFNTKPFQLINRENIEFLIIPHQSDYKDYINWEIPEKKSLRLAISHGIVSGMSFTGIDKESGGNVIDPDLFVRNQIDYAAMGHIHAKRSEIFGKTMIHYPGSARIWRKGETGEHGVNLLEIENSINCKFIPLQNAGKYFELNIPFSLEGKIEKFENYTKEWNTSDWVHLNLTGIVEDENNVTNTINEIEEKYLTKLRKLSIDRSKIDVLSGISLQPLAKKFLDILEEKKQNFDYNFWLKLRELGLREIKNILEAKK